VLCRLEYETCDVFLLGCPLALVLLKRKMICTTHYGGCAAPRTTVGALHRRDGFV
jgi:hypothetical protein